MKNRTSMATLVGTHNYSYDKIYQLLQATHPNSATETYTYDPVHNRLSSTTHDDWTYDSNNRLISYDSMAFNYVANGNMISKTDTTSTEVTSYQYDYENRLTRIDYADGTYSQYAYDPFGNRVKKDVNGEVNWFIYDFANQLPDVISEYDNSGLLIVGFTHGPGVDEVISMRRGADSYYYLSDGLGSITSLADSTEAAVNTYEYDSFGNVVNKTGATVNPYGYTGRRLDNESGLMYYRTRYYNQDTGRFITADPIGFAGGINFYSYVFNNPINAFDPTGLKDWVHKSESEKGGRVAAVGGWIAFAGLLILVVIDPEPGTKLLLAGKVFAVVGGAVGSYGTTAWAEGETEPGTPLRLWPISANPCPTPESSETFRSRFIKRLQEPFLPFGPEETFLPVRNPGSTIPIDTGKARVIPIGGGYENLFDSGVRNIYE
jgi:RHS repeat-associated protein